ncbi:hypothetical protein Plhal304r1_c018g0064551 [Plasmopara halstedii]
MVLCIKTTALCKLDGVQRRGVRIECAKIVRNISPERRLNIYGLQKLSLFNDLIRNDKKRGE